MYCAITIWRSISHHITSDLAITLNRKIFSAEEVKTLLWVLGKAIVRQVEQQQSDQTIEAPFVGVQLHCSSQSASSDVRRACWQVWRACSADRSKSGLKDRLGAGDCPTWNDEYAEGIR